MRKTLLPLILASLLVAPGCVNKATRPINFPSAVDVEALAAPKPKVTPEVLTSQKTADQYSSDVEAWGDSVSNAGKRVCQWFNNRGGKFDCK